jgi:hypothetical protein
MGSVAGMPAALGLLLHSDAETRPFLLVSEAREPLSSRGFDHLGFRVGSREAGAGAPLPPQGSLA